MIAAAQARQQLEQLGFTEAAAVLDGRLETAAQKRLPYADFLADLLGTETTARRERSPRPHPAGPLAVSADARPVRLSFSALDRQTPGPRSRHAHLRDRGGQRPAAGTARRGQDASGHRLRPARYRARLRSLLRP